MKIIIGGGGTGGHLVPGIALAQELKEQGHEIKYVLRTQDLDFDITERLSNDEKLTVSLSGMTRKISLRFFKNIFMLLQAWLKVFVELYKFKPDIMIISGGYVSNIVALSAVLMFKPLYILEQNSVAGYTNRFWAKFAKKVFTTFPFPKFISPVKSIHTGNPLFYKDELSVEKSKEIFELPNNNKKIIGISGGSQGAKFINNMILRILPDLVKEGFQIVWSLGTIEYDRLQHDLEFLKQGEYRDNVRIYRFISRMDAFWSGSSIVLARAGAGTVSESMHFKTPTLFIPIHKSPDNHQYLNAQFLAEKRCSYILEEPTLNQHKLKIVLMEMADGVEELKEKFPIYDQDPAKQICAYVTSETH